MFTKRKIIFLKNKKLYLEGKIVNTDKDYIFNIVRIKKIDNIIESDNEYKPTTCTVKYQLKNVNNHELPIKQKLVHLDNGIATIIGEFSNDFFATQHMLSYGADCTVIEPVHIKEAVIKQLMEIKNIYE